MLHGAEKVDLWIGASLTSKGSNWEALCLGFGILIFYLLDRHKLACLKLLRLVDSAVCAAPHLLDDLVLLRHVVNPKDGRLRH